MRHWMWYEASGTTYPLKRNREMNQNCKHQCGKGLAWIIHEVQEVKASNVLKVRYNT
jgi:galactose mutarotase-like enzyme